METLQGKNLSPLFFYLKKLRLRKEKKKENTPKSQGHTATKQDKPWAVKLQNLYSLSPPSCLSHILIYNKEFS